jgi:hypothetical protein
MESEERLLSLKLRNWRTSAPKSCTSGTVLPAVDKNIPVYILNSASPQEPARESPVMPSLQEPD